MPPYAQRIACFDADAFFCRCAYLTWPERLAGVELLVVGGHPQRRGVVSSCSYAARQQGVHSGMSMARALALAPGAVAAPVPWATVRAKSRQVFAVVRALAPVVERASVDEGYALLPGDDAEACAAAHAIRAAVLERTGIETSWGVSRLRYLAKMATRPAKPGRGGDGVFVVPAGAELGFLDAHAPEQIPFLGPALAADLAKRGVTTIPSLRALDLRTLTLWLGPARARFVYERARGIDRGGVSDVPEPRKSVSSETTFERDVSDAALLDAALDELVADLVQTLGRERFRARTVSVKLRDARFAERQKSRTLDEYVGSQRVILHVARTLLRESARALPGPYRLLHAGVSNLLGPGGAEQLRFREILPSLEDEPVGT